MSSGFCSLKELYFSKLISFTAQTFLHNIQSFLDISNIFTWLTSHGSPVSGSWLCGAACSITWYYTQYIELLWYIFIISSHPLFCSLFLNFNLKWLFFFLIIIYLVCRTSCLPHGLFTWISLTSSHSLISSACFTTWSIFPTHSLHYLK